MNNISGKLNALQAFPTLKSLNAQEFELIASKAIYNVCAKDTFIYKESQKASEMYFLVKGKVKLASNTECGKTLIKEIVHADQLFGENIFQDQAIRSEYAITSEADTQYLKVDKSVILELVYRNQAFSEDLMKLIMTRMNNLEQRMKNFIFLKAKSRISEFIGRMGAQRGIRIGIDEWLINHGLSHKEIAYMTDTSRQTVARVLSELKQDDLIHFSARKPSKILIRDIAALRMA